jgi:hypothetical protein
MGQDPHQPPSPEQREAMIAEVRQKALAYTKSLPDFLCTQVTHRYSARVKAGTDPDWTLHDTLTIRLSYFEEKEDYRVIQVNGKPTAKTLGQVGGWTAKGDFGSMLRGVFAAKSETQFEWQRWDSLNGRPAAVLAYRIERAHSQFHSTGQRFLHTVRANWGASGLVFADADTRQVVRLTVDSAEMPPGSPTKEVHIVLEYAYQKIGDREFLLPSQSTSLMTVQDQRMRLDSRFTAYQKFSADTEIKYAPTGEDQTPVKK